VPVIKRELAGDDGGPPLGAVIEHLQEVTAVDVRERGKAQVVQDQDFDPGELLQQARLGPVPAGQGEV